MADQAKRLLARARRAMHEAERLAELARYWATTAAGADPEELDELRTAITLERERAERLTARATSVLEDRSDRVASCCTTGMTLSCKCGPRRVAVGCGQRWLCDVCRARCYAMIRRAALRAWRARWSEQYRRWQRAGRPRGAAWRYYFLRLSVRHSGNVATDRELIVDAWTKCRNWINREIGRRHPYYRRRSRSGKLVVGVRFPYQLTWEATAGADGLGHVHAHVIVLWPWFDWSGLDEQWREATDGESNHVRIESVRAGSVDGKHTRRRGTERDRAADAVLAAADYVAKYASKGVTLETFDGDLAGATLAAFYCKRVVSTSYGFHVAEECRCRECGCTFDIREPPEGRHRKLAQAMRRTGSSERAPPMQWLYDCGVVPPTLVVLK
jgi:hypothetical protein